MNNLDVLDNNPDSAERVSTVGCGLIGWSAHLQAVSASQHSPPELRVRMLFAKEERETVRFLGKFRLLL